MKVPNPGRLDGVIGKQRLIVPDAAEPPQGFILVNRRSARPVYIDGDLKVQRGPGHDRLYVRAGIPLFETAEQASAWKAAKGTDDLHHESTYGATITNFRVLEHFMPHEVKHFLDPEHFRIVHADPEYGRALVEIHYVDSPHGEGPDMPKRRLFLIDGENASVLASETFDHRREDAVDLWNSCHGKDGLKLDREPCAPGLAMGQNFGSLDEASAWAGSAAQNIRSRNPAPSP